MFRESRMVDQGSFVSIDNFAGFAFLREPVASRWKLVAFTLPSLGLLLHVSLRSKIKGPKNPAHVY